MHSLIWRYWTHASLVRGVTCHLVWDIRQCYFPKTQRKTSEERDGNRVIWFADNLKSARDRFQLAPSDRYFPSIEVAKDLFYLIFGSLIATKLSKANCIWTQNTLSFTHVRPESKFRLRILTKSTHAFAALGFEALTVLNFVFVAQHLYGQRLKP